MDVAVSPLPASSSDPLRGILASPCHRSQLEPDSRWNSRQPVLRCSTCGTEFHARQGVYDFRLKHSNGTGAHSSFESQWQRYQRGEFEHDTLYGADADAELKTALDAFGASAGTVAGSWILDAGCGSGRLGNSLARLGANVVSVDLADTIRLLARRNRQPNLHYLQADLMFPPLEANIFDRVWSAGVLHHIADPHRAFDRLAALVRPGGTLSIWLYSAERFSPFLAIRRILPFVSRMPEPAAAALCRALAIPLYVAGTGAPMIGRRRLPLATVRFGLYDSLTPRYQSRHTEREVRNWFVANGFVRIRKWSELGLTAERSG
ncbi:MAG TPA: class I SAM-dependent methyltransferase [Candidatus Binataceae bacterium]|nr:class I SAM-dependent methyltransferase [Candidatus Binataceae bacterium]